MDIDVNELLLTALRASFVYVYLLVKSGKIQHKALARARLNEDELWSGLRMMEVDDIKEVKQATLEPSGQLSVLLEDWAKPAQKRIYPG